MKARIRPATLVCGAILAAGIIALLLITPGYADSWSRMKPTPRTVPGTAMASMETNSMKPLALNFFLTTR